jgi:hypothetical protein
MRYRLDRRRLGKRSGVMNSFWAPEFPNHKRDVTVPIETDIFLEVK